MRWFGFTVMGLCLVGCVSKSKFVELETEYRQTKTALEGELADRDADIDALKADVERLEKDKATLNTQLMAKEAALADLRETNANILNDKGKLRGEVDNMKQALAELEERKAAADARLDDFRDLVGRFKSLIDAGTLEVKIKDGRMVVAMATDVLFASGSATLSDDGKQAVAKVSEILASMKDREFQVEGHTDDDPISTKQFPNNWSLASQRALNVVDHMLASGMVPGQLSGASFGEFRPEVANDTPENKSLNRRIEIVVVPDLSQLPGYDELGKLAQ